MDISKVRSVFFSPTGTTRKLVNAFVEELSISEKLMVDITLERASQEVFSANELLVLAVPVYSGRVPSLLVDYLRSLKGNETPVVLMAVYGNAKYDDVLVELQDVIEPNGFNVIAYGLFVGEHSFSNDSLPTAQGRPDQDDLAMAGKFAREVNAKLDQISDIASLEKMDMPGNRPYVVAKPKDLGVPRLDADRCVDCKSCAVNCPAGAIDHETLDGDGSKCILCYACVRGCPKEARLDHDTIQQVRKKLNGGFSEPKTPKWVV